MTELPYWENPPLASGEMVRAGRHAYSQLWGALTSQQRFTYTDRDDCHLLCYGGIIVYDHTLKPGDVVRNADPNFNGKRHAADSADATPVPNL